MHDEQKQWKELIDRMAGRPPLFRKSDIAAPPARLSGGAPPSTPIAAVTRRRVGRPPGSFGRKRRAEMATVLDKSESASESTSNFDDDEMDTDVEFKKGKSVAIEKVRKPRKKRRFRFTDSVAKAKKKAERRAQLEAERREIGDESSNFADAGFEVSKPNSPTPLLPEAPNIRLYSPMQLLCDNLLRKLLAKDPEEYFVFPVTSSIAPDYHDVIKEPMDFSSMRLKIEANEYLNVMVFHTDARLIVSNALTYNDPSTIYYLAAQKLKTIIDFYFSEQHLLYLYHTLPFCKYIPMEQMGIAPKGNLVTHSRVQRHVATEYMSTSNTADSAHQSTESNLSARIPDCEASKGQKFFLSRVGNEDGTISLNIINPTTSDRSCVTIGEIVGRLDAGNPGICSPAGRKVPPLKPISILSYGPFSSFAPQFDSTWANLCETDSRLLLSTYSNRQTRRAFSQPEFVEDVKLLESGDSQLGISSGDEDQQVLGSMKSENSVKNPADTVDMDKLLNEVESLENFGMDVSFVADFRKIFQFKRESNNSRDTFNETGQMICDLALLQRIRLSSEPPVTVTDQPPPSEVELNLAAKVQNQIQSLILQCAKPRDVVSSENLLKAMGLNSETVDS